jgi:CubicO group peptidase (beta-lactamase class C family)
MRMKASARATGFLLQSLTVVAAVGMVLEGVASAGAGETHAGTEHGTRVTQMQKEGPTDLVELEAFLDDLMARDMQEHDIAGSAVAVVKDGKLFFAKGYGYADLEQGIPVDPEQTIFSIGSVGKTFTWTAVMQMVEQGKLDLDADINTYLDFHIPDTFPEPITLKHLMTHTSGFEDKLLGSAVTDPGDLVPPREWILSHMSKRLYPAGYTPGYANFNAILAGYIVSRVSGEPYEEYMQNHIFGPLGMTHSTVQSPMPPGLREHASVGYTYEDGAFKPFPGFLAQPGGYPSGMHQASATDMARFMIAHLQGGRYSDAEIPEARLLNESTAKLMQTTAYQYDPRMLGTTHGFFDLSENGQFTLGSSGYLPPMHSLLLLMPEQNLGVFVTYNSAGAGALTLQHSGFQKAFFDHYYPAAEAHQLQPPTDFAERASRFAGVYRVSSAPNTTLIKIVELFGAYRMQVDDPGDGTLLVSVEGLAFHFGEVEPLFFRQVDGPFSMVFRQDGRGRITEMYTDVMPQYGAVKLQWYEATPFNMALALSCVLVFLCMLVVAAIRALRRRRAGSEATPEPRLARVAWRMLVWICALNLLFIVGTALWGNPPTELHEVSFIAKVVLGLGVVAAVLTVGAVVFSVLAWKDRYWGIVSRLFYSIVTIGAVAFVWFLNYWNLLGWRY